MDHIAFPLRCAKLVLEMVFELRLHAPIETFFAHAVPEYLESWWPLAFVGANNALEEGGARV